MSTKYRNLKFIVAIVSLGLIFVIGYGLILPNKSPLPELNAELSGNDFLLGDYYFNHGPYADGTYDLTLARYHYEKALSDNPAGDNWAWYQLGRIDFLEGKFDAAIFKFKKQIEYFNDQQPSVYYMLGLAYGYKARQSGSVEDWQKAADGFIKYLEQDPDNPWARVDLSWVYFSQGRFEEMLPILVRGIEVTPNNAWLLNMYGLALLNTGDREGAKEQFITASIEAERLTPEEWGQSYPGNDPNAWAEGLREFREAIGRNLDISSS